MLSFATEFPVEERDPNKFVDAVRQWIAGSPHTQLKADDFDHFPSDGMWHSDAENERIEAIATESGGEHIIAFRHLMMGEALNWTTTVVFSVNNNDTWVGVRTKREAVHLTPQLPEARKPFVIKNLLQGLRGGVDGELRVGDTPVYLSEQDLGRATRLINGDGDNHLPCVYVSCDFDGTHNINVQALSRSLAGMAHIIVEPSRSFSRMLQQEVESRNVYGGVVGVYWANYAKHTFFLPSEFASEYDLRKSVVEKIRLALIHRRPLSRCTWETAEVSLARSAFEQLRNSGSDRIEDYVEAFDREIAARSEQLREAEQEILRLNAKLRSPGIAPQAGGLSLSTGNEQEFFPGEFIEVIYDALCECQSRVVSGSRRQHILSAVVNAMPVSTRLKDKKEIVKALLRDYTSMSGDTLGGLQSLGFQVTSDGKHHKLIYNGDDRYVFPLPKSGSDRRGGLNSASDISKRVF